MEDPGLDQDFPLKGHKLESEPQPYTFFSKFSKEKHASKHWSEGERTWGGGGGRGGAPTSTRTYSVISQVRYQEAPELFVSLQRGHRSFAYCKKIKGTIIKQ